MMIIFPEENLRCLLYKGGILAPTPPQPTWSMRLSPRSTEKLSLFALTNLLFFTFELAPLELTFTSRLLFFEFIYIMYIFFCVKNLRN
ncbi:hypothetical protein PBCV1_a236L [Paramecium bursaria Chlorella virus 1]|uniref:Uncharacterized protein n=1 Tax=Paramecium bursaria Chlorella virus 1 TaxID=10506 RepID=Q84556_PBCV1|nr:hypothetical protein PBCV1_a236L [Paramecium bursaria Chlorella virus 1]AAC96604.1 hypothetical protein [Paramecium bursaria Chlorella virus 1]